jgi:quercetin dioxygenase-like cupin family protein
MRYHEDERRQAYCDLFDTPGDVNLFVIAPGQRTAWHRHQKQTDEFRVIHGSMMFQTIGPTGARSLHWLGHPSQRLSVLPNTWHGYENWGSEPAYLLMYLDQKYDASDEERLSETEVRW